MCESVCVSCPMANVPHSPRVFFKQAVLAGLRGQPMVKERCWIAVAGVWRWIVGRRVLVQGCWPASAHKP